MQRTSEHKPAHLASIGLLSKAGPIVKTHANVFLSFCRHGYNSSYANGNGQAISKPTEYYKAVASDKYGYNGAKK